jgi:hypothetical protein
LLQITIEKNTTVQQPDAMKRKSGRLFTSAARYIAIRYTNSSPQHYILGDFKYAEHIELLRAPRLKPCKKRKKISASPVGLQAWWAMMRQLPMSQRSAWHAPQH